MPDYLDEPSEEEIKLTESMQQADAETESTETAQPEQAEVQEAGDTDVSGEADDSKTATGTAEEPKVNLGALHEARATNKELRGELGQARERMAAMEGRLNQILEQIKAPEQREESAEAGPSYDEDPEGYYRHQIATQGKKIESLENAGKQTQEWGKQAEERQEFMSRYQAAAQEYGAEQTDFMDAYKWLGQNIDAELQARGFTDPLQRQQVLAQEEANMVNMAFKAGKNPAERLYQLAKHRGYKAEAKAEQQDDKIVNLGKAQEKAKSLSNAGGGSENSGTLEHLATLNGEEFDAAWDKLRRAGKLG